MTRSGGVGVSGADVNVEQLPEKRKAQSILTPYVFTPIGRSQGRCSRVANVLSVIVSTALLTFLAFYTHGYFHFETFIGIIGPAVSITLTLTLVALSAIALVSSFYD